MASMEGLLNHVGNVTIKVEDNITWYVREMKQIHDVAQEHYDEVRVHICSDHGMATVNETIDLMKTIESLPLEYGKDYVAVYDSTMARFWVHNDTARSVICKALDEEGLGRILSDDEHTELGCDFDNQKFGETIFLVDPGVIIVPSHMGLKPITGMHGYHPDHPDSDAALLSNVAPIGNVDAITDLFDLMKVESGIRTTQ